MKRGLPPFVFVSGGCRSGKSAYAQSLAERYAGQAPALFLATAHLNDEETRARVAAHRLARGPLWRTLEPLPGGEAQLWRKLPALARGAGAVLLDSLTLWLSAAMENILDAEALGRSSSRLLLALRGLPCPVILVSDELGLGLAPADSGSRFFRDALGLANQQAARLATQAVLIISGLPLLLKGDSLP
ncbi:MAG: bifunctional adenosylcobinamide kinase/adenosylcobinamide-phosphate guanylyltransferase [Deltaproteobacteria bacterium]|jgi:adenosylcobinamide kinase/adenosylcobinamide-phosphate guanylyltransferase|nr:bifunctional adenosylcobinamide kinase/adenosylcobinamide-phosphate guanylyltransferase [Deltaproteobacteria bacterium]